MIRTEVYPLVQRSYSDPVIRIKLINFISPDGPIAYFLYISTHSLLISSRLLVYVWTFHCLLTVGSDRKIARLLSIYNRVLLYSLFVKQRYDVFLLDYQHHKI